MRKILNITLEIVIVVTFLLVCFCVLLLGSALVGLLVGGVIYSGAALLGYDVEQIFHPLYWLELFQHACCFSLSGGILSFGLLSLAVQLRYYGEDCCWKLKN